MFYLLVDLFFGGGGGGRFVLRPCIPMFGFKVGWFETACTMLSYNIATYRHNKKLGDEVVLFVGEVSSPADLTLF